MLAALVTVGGVALAMVLWQRLQPRVPTDERRDLYLDRQRVTLVSGFEGRTRLETWTDVSADPGRDPVNPDRDEIALLAPRQGLLRWMLGADRPGELRLSVARLVTGPAADDAPARLAVHIDDGTGVPRTVAVDLPPAPTDPDLSPSRQREGPAASLVAVLPRGAAMIELELSAPAGGFAVLLSPHVVLAPAPVRVEDLRVDAPQILRLLPRVKTSESQALFAQRRCVPEIDAGADRVRARAAAEAAPRVKLPLPEIEPVGAFTGPPHDARAAVAFTGLSVLTLELDVPAGAHLRGALALDARLSKGSAASVTVRVDGESLASLDVGAVGWQELDVPLGSHTGPGRTLELAVTQAIVPSNVVEMEEVDYARRQRILALYEPAAVRLGLADPRLEVSRRVPGRAASVAQPSVILIQVETLRADALPAWAGVDGHDFCAALGLDPADIAPRLAELVKRATLWRRGFTPSPWTVPSTVSLLTGLSPSSHGATTHDHMALPGDVPTLAERAAQAGVATGAVVSSDLLTEAAGYARGFQSFAHVPYANARQVNDLAEAFVVDHAQQQFFLFLHEFDPHSPYAAPEPFRDRYVPEELRGRTVAEVEARLQAVTEAIQLRGHAPPPADDPDLRWYRGRYLGEIAWWDSQLGRLLDALEQLKLDDTTIVVLTSDHGEEFFEHGLFGHGSNLYDETLHVPLLVAAPPAGWNATLPFAAREDVVGTEGLHASVLEWLGIPFDPDSVRPPLRRPTGMAFSETDKGLALDGLGDPFRRSLDSLRTSKHRATVSWSLEDPSGPHAPDQPVQQLVQRDVFDVRADPEARAPLPESPITRQAIQQVLDTVMWCEAHRAAQAPAGLSADTLEALGNLGYTGGPLVPRKGAATEPAAACRHPACDCKPAADEAFCSEACRKAMQAGGAPPCGCGREGCRPPR